MKAHTEMDKRQVLLDMYVSYVGDVEINVEIKKYFCKAGVKGIQLHGMLRVILEPLIGDVPLVGAITMFFIQRPRLDINWTGITNLLDIPGLNAFSDTMIMDTISSFLVLPNRLTVPLVADLHVAQLRSPLPRGVVRIHLKEAQNLLSTDTLLGGAIKGKSDPYVILRVGTQTFTSKTVDDDLNPKWNEMYEVIVHEVPGQELELEVFDKDPDQDDFLGRLKMDLGCVKKARVLDQWMPLKDVEKGRVHLRLEWLSLLSTTSKLEQVLQQNSILSTKISEPPSAAILAVYLDRAQELPMKKGNKDPSPVVLLSVQDTTRESRLKKNLKEPKAGAELSLGGVVHRTKLCERSTAPVWEEAFTFLVKNPYEDMLLVKRFEANTALSLQLSHSWGLPLGSLVVSMKEVLAGTDLTVDRWFQLDGAGPESQILLRATLRVLVPKSTDCSVREGGPEFRTALVADSTTPGESMELQEEPIPVNISSKEESGTSQDLRHRQVSAQSLPCSLQWKVAAVTWCLFFTQIPLRVEAQVALNTLNPEAAEAIHVKYKQFCSEDGMVTVQGSFEEVDQLHKDILIFYLDSKKLHQEQQQKMEHEAKTNLETEAEGSEGKNGASPKRDMSKNGEDQVPAGQTIPMSQFHYDYLTKAYRREIEDIKQSSGVEMNSDVIVSFIPAQGQEGARVQKADDDFIHLFQNIVTNLGSLKIPLSSEEHGILEDNFKEMQSNSSRFVLNRTEDGYNLVGPQQDLQRVQKELMSRLNGTAKSARSELIEIHCEEELMKKDLEMYRVHWEFIKQLYSKQLQRIQEKFGVKIDGQPVSGSQEAVKLEIKQDKGNFNLQSHAFHAFLELYQKVATGLMSRSVEDASEVQNAKGRQ
ncbi:UNVERIFIED_CONTAM: hypothetical protein FKN15_068023 [Acipenser sinensis]